MNERYYGSNEAGTTTRRDDTSDDVMAAYREVQERASQAESQTETPAPRNDESGADGNADLQGDRGDGRTPRGTFAPRKPADSQGSAGKPVEGEAGASDPASGKPATEHPDASQVPSGAPSAPPPSWGVKAKAAWDKVPVDVQAEIAKREGEVAQGFAALRDYKDLKPYADMARQHNTTIAQALSHYTAIDNLMKQDLAGGLAVAAESYGITKQNMGQFFLDMAKRYGAQVSGQPGARSEGHQDGGSDEDPLMAVLQPALAPILNELSALKAQTSSRAEADRNAQVQSLATEIERFAADPKNVFYANVETEIMRIFEKGLITFSGNPAKDLQAAYDLAIWQNPETRAALIERQVAEQQGTQRQKEQEKVAKARDASRSIGGSKLPGTIYKDAANGDGSDDIEAEVRRAYRQHAQA